MAGLEHAVGLAVGDDGGGVVEEPIEHGDGGGVFGQEPSPVLEGVVGGSDSLSWPHHDGLGWLHLVGVSGGVTV